MIQIDQRSSRPIYEQVREGFVKLIASGALPPGSKLPSVRTLASQTAINPNTIQRAYRELEAAGYIVSQAGRGSFVAENADVVDARTRELLDQFGSLAAQLIEHGISADQLNECIAEASQKGASL